MRISDWSSDVCSSDLFTDDAFDLDLVKETIVAMGLAPKPARHLVERHGYLAGTDADRAADVNAMFADPEVRAVFATRGGWGCERILPYLDFAKIRANPKLLVGFSEDRKSTRLNSSH